MQYFVVLEDSKEFRWQAELLFESIRLLGLENKFIVSICPGKGPMKKHPYPEIIWFDNVGRKLGFPHFNKCYGLAKAIESGKLRQPFVILDTDMFLISELPQLSQVVVSQNQEHLLWEEVKHTLKDTTNANGWVNAGEVYYFNDVPNATFENIMRHTYGLCAKYGNHKKFHTYGFNIGIAKSDLTVRKRNLVMPLFNDRSSQVNWNAPIVHYSKGYPPYFQKEGAFDTINFSFNLPLPFKAIMEAPIRDQPNVSVMQTLIRSWLDSNVSRLWDLIG
jgi:hypothetical protein